MRILPLLIATSLAIIWDNTRVSAISDKVDQAASALVESISVHTASGPVPGAPTDIASARAAVLAGNYTSRLHHQGRDRCPSKCTVAGIKSSAWYVYGGLKSLDRACDKTMLLDFALLNPVDGPKSHVSISACTADLELPAAKDRLSPSSSSATCVSEDKEQTQLTSSLHLATLGSPSSSANVSEIITTLHQVQALLAFSDSGCNETIKYAYSRNVAIGVYAGSGLAHQGVLESAVAMLSTQIQSQRSVAETISVQLCSNSSTRYSLGIIASTKGDLGVVQRGLQSMRNGSCAALDNAATIKADWNQVTYLAPSLLHGNNSVGNLTTNSTNLNRLSLRNLDVPVVGRADTCDTIQVEFGDSCASLAAECGITAAQFTEYNSDPGLCSSLSPGQHVCCTAGSLPDFSPKPDEDGYCYPYLVKTGDSCATLAAAYSLTNDKIEEYNKNTWGWNGCQKIFADYNICLSSGYPPMPAPVANAVCGPQVNGTVKAPPGTDLATLNQCPLNACCNIYGQCGTTEEFCTPSESPSGAPGTAAPGENGCISNCGTDIIVSDAPSETYDIAYFEAFDWQRPCLRMSVTDIDTSLYTHIHLSFITFNEDFSINTDDVGSQLSLFRGMSGPKKIVSVGGWTFSTDPSTYTIFRNAVASEANRQTMITNVVNFLNDYNLDGIDWDWEYPDEPDIPGIPAGTEDEASGYFLLLDELKKQMPAGKTVSVTAPASFWYLQHFPIQAIALVVDYLVYLTYDLHGQWDYSNKYADPGCVSFDQGLGNCLRSHVNLTETINALSMITKAGVPSNIIAVGVSSYGRSFQMTTAGCWTEQCTYTGPDSGAYPGLCTTTPGYLANYEIDQILRHNPTAQIFRDQSSFSDIVVFNSTQWVAYMNDTNKGTRKALFPALHFLGSADWAVDLQSESGGSGSNSGNSSSGDVYIDPDIWSSVAPLVTAPPGVTLIWPPMPLASPTTITFPPWTTTVSYSSVSSTTSTRSDGSTTIIPWLVWASWLTVLTIPPVTTTEIPVWGVIIDTSSTAGVITLTSSVQPPPFTITVTPTLSGETSIIGATTTSTSSGDPIIWGTVTWSPPVQTETLGGTTTVIGGLVLPPAVITITPNPHPTTTPDPGTTDPVLNSHKPSWTSGATAHPTVSPGCIGCGLPCILFCDPGCPFCPPGVFGPNSGAGGGSSGDPDDNDDDDDDDDDDDPDDPMHTIVFDAVSADTFPTVFLADADANSIFSDILSGASTAFGIASTTTTTTKTTTTTTSIPTPTPHAICNFYDEFFFWTFNVLEIEGWSTDGGKKLKSEESGCGALTGWIFDSDDSGVYAVFNLPLFIASGCVERAIVSAGGPKLSCINRTYDRQASPQNSTQLEEFTEFYQAMQPVNGPHSYVPMDWSTTTAAVTASPVTTTSVASP